MDNLGGFSESVEVQVKITDINDNSPQFSRVSYQVYANERETVLLSQLLIRVTDQDEEDNPNSIIQVRVLLNK